WTPVPPLGSRPMRLRRPGDQPPGIRRVRISCALAGVPGALDVVPETDRRLSIVPEGVPGAPRTVTIPPQPRAELVGRQLSDRERDPVFRATMAVAQALAQGVLR